MKRYLRTGPPKAGSGPGETLFSGPPARADQLKFTLNQKDRLSVAERLWLRLAMLICTIDK